MRKVEVSQRAAALRAERVPFVHARVVLADRPTSAKPGDEAVVFADGTIEGFVGGTCAESTVRAQSLALLDTGEPLLLRITPAPEPETVAEPNKVAVHNPCLSGGTLEIFLEPVIPAPLLMVHGDSPIADALRGLAEELGHQVAAGSPEDLSELAAMVCASHGRDEAEVLEAALRAGVPYVGLVASRKRGESVVGALDVDEALKARVHTPAGLDIGARTPEEVALSILAEIVAERRRASGRPVGLDELDQRGELDQRSGLDQREGLDELDQRGELDQREQRVATDPVCGMSVATVETSLHLDHDGVRYWFCGSGCLRAFAADPAGYLAS